MKITHPFPWATGISFDAHERETFGPIDLISDGAHPRLLRASFEEKQLYKTVVDGEPVYESRLTANGEVTEIANARKVPDRTVSRATLTFSCAKDELLTGLGQHDAGVYDYHGKTEYLYQNNMIIAYPFLLSSAGYGILIEAECAMRFDGGEDSFTFTLEAVDGFSLVVFKGGDAKAVLRHLAAWSGKTRLLPKWAYGYIQSKERYKSSEDLIETARRFRQEELGLDCLVQDWHTWKQGLWGDKTPDPARFPDIPKLTNELHAMNTHLLISVWPNMAKGGADCAEFEDAGMMLPNSTTYDAFSEEARALYGQQCERHWGAGGVDGYWCDNAEPFSDADWNGETKRPEAVRYQLVQDLSRRSMDETSLNSYALYHAQGMYEFWRAHHPDKRLVNLTRSGYPGAQKYGAVLWSGDISARWDVLRSQIAEGLKAAMSGVSHWTLDIGGFFVVKDAYEKRGCECHTVLKPLWFWNGEYNDGVHDPAYRELYVRWLQMGCFLPMFRSHGTDTPREPWQFGSPGDVEYDTIKGFIDLRYRLMPYVYSTAASCWFDGLPMLRSLMVMFPEDRNARNISDQFMLGDALLITPVTRPLSDGGGLTRVYLPQSAGWYDLFTEFWYPGGRWIDMETPLTTLPVFVKAGSILPRATGGTCAADMRALCDEATVYTGADGEAWLYDDAGDGYAYEDGAYARVRLTWDDRAGALTFHASEGGMTLHAAIRVRIVRPDGSVHERLADYRGVTLTLHSAS
jgi:alpha-D-xyloside xylohydrolase